MSLVGTCYGKVFAEIKTDITGVKWRLPLGGFHDEDSYARAKRAVAAAKADLEEDGYYWEEDKHQIQEGDEVWIGSQRGVVCPGGTVWWRDPTSPPGDYYAVRIDPAAK